MENKNDVEKIWIKCSLICYLTAFIIFLIIMEIGQIGLIKGNSYYLSNVTVFLKTILWPVQSCIIYSMVVEIICQIIFWVFIFLVPKEKRNQIKIAYIIIPIISFILFIILVVSILSLVDWSIPF